MFRWTGCGPYYADVKRWFAWEDDLEDMDLDRDFITGTTARMTMTGQPPMPCALVEVGEGRSFTDKSTVPGVGDVHSAHELEERNGVRRSGTLWSWCRSGAWILRTRPRRLRVSFPMCRTRSSL